MAAKGSHINFMFLAPPPPRAAGSDAAICNRTRQHIQQAIYKLWLMCVLHVSYLCWITVGRCIGRFVGTLYHHRCTTCRLTRRMIFLEYFSEISFKHPGWCVWLSLTL